MNNEFGGYFEISIDEKHPYHSDAIELNTGRNCFEYILLTNKTKRAFIPYYTCEVMLEPLIRNNIKYEFYSLNEDLSPVIPQQMRADECFLYTNYFGVKESLIQKLSTELDNLVIDNTMAFYAKPIQNIPSFNSVRKFFGVPDGAYLFTDKKLETEPEDNYSHDKMLHLFKRIEKGANKAYGNFLENDLSHSNQPIRKMSEISKLIMAGVDHLKYKFIRERNFLFLHHTLGKYNELQIDISDLNGPMFYPFLFDNEALRSKLIQNKIYVPHLWKNTLETAKEKSFEHYLTDKLFALPIDQRYSLNDMQFILNTIGLNK